MLKSSTMPYGYGPKNECLEHFQNTANVEAASVVDFLMFSLFNWLPGCEVFGAFPSGTRKRVLHLQIKHYACLGNGTVFCLLTQSPRHPHHAPNPLLLAGGGTRK